jgi:hypothetical protein
LHPSVTILGQQRTEVQGGSSSILVCMVPCDRSLTFG